MDYKSTLNLPQTEFPMKASLPVREPEQVRLWDEKNTYKLMTNRNGAKQKFVLHDGPPYANGNIHLGHTLNKVLKDIVVKYKNLLGYHCAFIPGWDCHGLPIELGVEKQLREKKQSKANLTKVEIRNLCKQYALEYIHKQRDQFKRLGIFADWENPYLTMSDNYVANIVRELGRISSTGNLYKGNKPVYWCMECATALADAEIEYQNHTSPSVYVKFTYSTDELNKNETLKKYALKPVSLVIWTTTPWTLPANLGICLHPEFEYTVLDTGSELLIVADGLSEKFILETGLEAKKIEKISSKGLEGTKVQHPFMPRTSLVILGDHVTLEAGTGAVHTAPGHGVEDFAVGRKYGLEAIAPVDAHGYFTEEVLQVLPETKSIKVQKANVQIIERLKNSGHLLQSKPIQHSYPHCWRCHHPVIFRATPQWFIGMEKTNLRKKSIEQIHNVEWIPQWGINRILGMVENRPDWCISRQRIWGVPITVFYCKKCGEALQQQENFHFIAELIAKHGPNVWYEWPVEKLLKPNAKCECGESSPEQFQKETDILDVWFDSGVSHAAVLDDPKNQNQVSWPADLYLEGSDQHRGWFQTSLLTAVATRGQAPYRKVLTHGFVNDKEGKKMSKSKGNVTDPLDFISKYGAEILRLWVVLEDYRNDVNFSMETIERVSESYRKIRNTFRYILGNLYDFDSAQTNNIEFCELDQWALERTYRFLKRLQKAYDSYEFHTAYHALVNFCTVELSAVYFDILKDRLYTSGKNSKERCSSQKALDLIGRALAVGLAPILSFTSEEVWKYLKNTSSVFEENFPLLDSFWAESTLREQAALKIEKVLELREPINKALELARAAKEIGHPLEAFVQVQVPKEKMLEINSLKEDLARLFIVSKIEFTEANQIDVKVSKAEGQKCARCWVYSKEVGSHSEHPQICSRCVTAIAG